MFAPDVFNMFQSNFSCWINHVILVGTLMCGFGKFYIQSMTDDYCDFNKFYLNSLYPVI